MEVGENEPPLKLKFNNLPKDIIFDIFSRIPLKSLCQYRIVCKKWQFYLCLNPEFRLFYHQKHKINPILLFNHLTPEPPSTHFSSFFIDGTPLTQISINFAQPLLSILTCNGILCLISENRVFLYDPITKLHSQLPNSINFDSSLSWAFGFSRIRNVFKVLHFYTIDKFDNFHYCPIKEKKCEIVTTPISDLWVDDHLQVEWRDLGFCPNQFTSMKKNYAFVDGKFYWLIKEKIFNQIDFIKIMSFDLELEVFGMVNYILNGPIQCMDLVEINEKLCMTHRKPWEQSMSVWVMKKDFDGIGEFWVKNYWIDLKGVNHHDVKILGYFPRNNNSGDGEDEDEDEDEGEILMKFGKQSFGFYGINDGVFRDMSSEINLENWSLEWLLNRKSLL